MRRFRLLLAIAVLALVAATVTACGGGSESPSEVIDQTFSGDKTIDSGDLSVKVSVKATGQDGGDLNAELSGPFENEGEKKVPKFDLTANASLTGSQNDDFSFEGGLTSTGEAAFVNYQGTEYEVDQSLFDRFKEQVESGAGQQQANQQSGQELFGQLGIDDPQSLLTNLKDEGDADVEGTETTHISGDLDIKKAVDSFKNLLGSASALGALGVDTNLPSPDDLDRISEGVKTAHFDVYSGKDDHILRRLTITISIVSPAELTDKVDLDLAFKLGGVNESQTIEAPAGAKPFSDLLSELGIPPGALGALGALGGGQFEIERGEVPALPGGGATGGGASAAQLQKYLQCLQTSGDPVSCESLIR